MPPLIALTGGIGAGKSTALAALERLGAATISSDAIVHELYATPDVREAVTARFGPDVAPGNAVDRGRLAAVAFATDEGRHWLEQLLWPLVRDRVTIWREHMNRREPPPRALVVEVPLLFESGGERLYDATIAVISDERLRERRARERGHSSVAEREARQLTQEQKAERATYVVLNDGSIDELDLKLSKVLEDLAGADRSGRVDRADPGRFGHSHTGHYR